MKPASEIPVPVATLPAQGPEPGRCIYCDQRCESKAFFHAYCLELQHEVVVPAAAGEPGSATP